MSLEIWEEVDYSHQYWSGDPSVLDRPPEISQFLQQLPRRAKRDALRTLRGRQLRTELYALDGSDREKRPYTVTEAQFGLREEFPPGKDEKDRPRIFFSFALAERTTQWERGDDPMTSLSFTDNYDAYGQPRRQISVAVPRGRQFLNPAEAGEPYLSTLTFTDYAQRDDEKLMVDRVARTTTYEVINDGSLASSALITLIKEGDAELEIIGQSINYYDGEAFIGLPFGQLGEYGVQVRSESLVLTDEILREAYSDDSNPESTLEIPPYLNPDGSVNWSDEYPVEFRNRLNPLAGYVYHRTNPYETGYFSITQRQQFDFHLSENGRGLPLITRDALGNDTSISYDNYELLPITVTDPVGLITSAVYDYRIMQPVQVTDPNGNCMAYGFSPLGLLTKTAVMGKLSESSGDTLDLPGTQLIYDFHAYDEREQPVSVHTIQRVHHVHDLDVPLPERDEND